MTIDQYLTIADHCKTKIMRKWISRGKNIFKDIQILVFIKTKDTDLLYCNTCGAMPDKVYGSPDPGDPKECLTCFKNNNSANEFFT